MQHKAESPIKARATAPTQVPTAILAPVGRPAQRWAAVWGGGAERVCSMVELPLKVLLVIDDRTVILFQRPRYFENSWE